MSAHRVTCAQLHKIFQPESIAVVGASTRPGTVGNDIFRNLLYAEFNGSVYPVNPKAKGICGVHCYASLADIPVHGRFGGADRSRRGRSGDGPTGDRQRREGLGRDLGRIQGNRATKAPNSKASSATWSNRPAFP